MSQSIRTTTESLIKDYLLNKNVLTDVTVYVSDSKDQMTLPKLVILCETAKIHPEIPDCLGNYVCSIRFSLFSNSDDTSIEAHRSRCADLMGTFQFNELNNVKDFFEDSDQLHLYDITFQSEDEGVDGRSWATVFNYEFLVVLPS